MTARALPTGLEALDALGGGGSLCCFVTSDQRPLPGAAGYVDWRLCGELSRVLRSGFFAGAAGDQLLVPSGGRLGPPRVFLVGLGPAAGVDEALLQRTLARAADMLVRAHAGPVALAFPPLPRDLVEAAVARAFLPRFEEDVAVFTGEEPVLR